VVIFPTKEEYGLAASQHKDIRSVYTETSWYTVIAMQKRSSKKQGPKDINETAFRIAGEAVGNLEPQYQKQKNPAAVELGRAGGLVGGKARADKLSAEQRSDIAKKAANTRWSKHNDTHQ